MRLKVVSALVLSAMFVSTGYAVAQDGSARAKPIIQVTKTALPQEETRKKMPLLLLAIIAAAADSSQNFRAKIQQKAD